VGNGSVETQQARLAPILARYHLDLVSGWYDGRVHEREIDAEWDAVLPA
jgi:inosose dehydratase